MVQLDVEIDSSRVSDLVAVVLEERSKPFLVTMQQVVVRNHDCNLAVFAGDAGHQSYASYYERLAHPRVEVPELLVLLAEPAERSNRNSLLQARRLEIGLVEQALHEHHICRARQLTGGLQDFASQLTLLFELGKH